jgi:hypothetical protein
MSRTICYQINFALNSKFEDRRFKKKKYKAQTEKQTNKWTDRWTGRMSLIEHIFFELSSKNVSLQQRFKIAVTIM